MFLSSLSRHNKDLEPQTLKLSACHSSWVLDKPCYSSILFRRQQENPSSQREGMPTQRLEEKRVEEHVGEGERERVRKGEKESERGGEREREHARGRERESFGSAFYMFFPPPGPALCKLGLARSAVCST